jgi:tetratricopeptide (TPR) repeat protein
MLTIGIARFGAMRKSAGLLLLLLLMGSSFAQAGPRSGEAGAVQLGQHGEPGTARPTGTAGANREDRAGEERLVVRVRLTFEAARRAFQQSPTNVTAAWEYGRACFDWADLATNNAQRVVIAEDGVIACRVAMRGDTNLAAGPYYLGMNLGQIARVKRFSALGLIEEMRDLFETARGLDDRLDEAGPDRNLGLLYRDAPGWPLSVGDRRKAEHHLVRAVELSPGYPENPLNLVEARLGWRQNSEAAAELEALQELLPRARRAYAGDAWALSWRDWDRRWVAVVTRARKLGLMAGP